MKSPFFIAEISANHNGSLSKLKKLIKTAKKYGADAVKLQTYTADMMTLNIKKKNFLIKDGMWKNRYLWDLYDSCKTPLSWHKEVFDYAFKEKILCFSSPFSIEAVDFLEQFNPKFYKIASFEITDLPLIKRVAKTRKHVIISTGMANLDEISAAFNCAKKYGAKKITLLYCVSNYPAKISDFNLNNISFLKKKFNCSVGLSDHCNDPKLAFAAILAGAELIEKHIALPGDTKAPDYKFSIKDKEILEYRRSINSAQKLLGKNFFFINDSNKKNRTYRRSIYAIKDIDCGEKITKEKIKILRPNFGIEPKFYYKILNSKSPIKIKANSPIPKNFLKKRI
jgi:pseudaminic acid synthase